MSNLFEHCRTRVSSAKPKIRKVERRSKRQLDYAETEYLRRSQRYEKSSAMQIYWLLPRQKRAADKSQNGSPAGGPTNHGTRPEKTDENFGNQPDGPPLRILRKAPRPPNETGRRDRSEGHFFHLSRRFFGKKRIFGFRTDNEQR